MRKLLLIIIDGVPYRNWRRLFGNLEGWVANGDARVWRMRATLPQANLAATSRKLALRASSVRLATSAGAPWALRKV